MECIVRQQFCEYGPPGPRGPRGHPFRPPVRGPPCSVDLLGRLDQ